MPGSVEGAVPGGSRKLSIVIPCFNERDHVAELLARVFAAPMPADWACEVIVVDDASSDGTQDVLRALDLPIRFVERKENGGKGTALTDGFKLATGSHLLIQDADLEYDPDDIAALLSALDGECTVVFGSRYLTSKRRGSRLLYFGVHFLTVLTNILYRARLTDVCTCYKLFPREAAPLFPKGGFEADASFAAILLGAGYSICEVPITYRPRTIAEGKKLKYHVGFLALYQILRFRLGL